MDKKNVVILTCQDLSDYKQPIAPAFWKMIEAYCRDGWRVVIINAHKNNVNLYQYQNRYWYCEFPIPFRNVSRIRKAGKVFALLKAKGISSGYIARAEYILARIKEKKQKCVIYAYEVAAVSAGKDLNRRYGFPLVTRFQGTILYDVPDTHLNRFRYYPHFNALKTTADLVIMTNDGTHGDKVLERLGNRSRNILFYRNGVEEPASTKKAVTINGVKDTDRVLMTLSRLSSWKRVDRAVSALPDVIKKYPDTKLVIVGYGEEEEHLRKLAKTLHVEKNVVFTGQISHEYAFSYLDRADIFLSLYDLSNVGNPLLEAMRCGKPVITLDVGDTKNVISDGVNGILLSIDEVSQIPEKINQLFENEEYAHSLGQNARKYAADHFWTWEERFSSELGEVNRLVKGKTVK